MGGTHYYVQSLLWRDTLLDTKKNAGRLLSDDQVKEPEEEIRANEAFLRDSDTATLYQKLKEVDPLMANKWHENDRRKITRSLQVSYNWESTVEYCCCLRMVFDTDFSRYFFSRSFLRLVNVRAIWSKNNIQCRIPNDWGTQNRSRPNRKELIRSKPIGVWTKS